MDIIVIAGVPRSACHKAQLKVTRVVHDVVSYDVASFTDGVLVVDYTGSYDSLDSDGYVVTCPDCGDIASVDVDEN